MKLAYKIVSYSTIISMALAIVTATFAYTVMLGLSTGLFYLGLWISLLFITLSWISLVIVAVTARRVTKAVDRELI